MDKIIEEQLSKVIVAKIPAYSPDTTEIIIRKHSQTTFQVGKFYILRLSDIMCSENSAVFVNWNNRVLPPKYIIGQVEKCVPNRILIAGCRFDKSNSRTTQEYLRLWVITEEIEDAQEIDPQNYI